MAQEAAIHLSGVTKRYPGVVANRDVELKVMPGEVHAVVGENGAGKSTLMKIIYGMVQPDSGTIEVDGRAVHFRSPREAIEAGIGMVHQHFMLADNFSVLENVILGSEPKSGVRIDFDTAATQITDLGKRYGLPLDPGEKVERLSVGERQRVEIIKVLYRGARILILDEPTAVLVPQEVSELFDSIRDLKRQGVTIIFISHKLDEVLEIADTITVMRGGRTVGTTTPAQVDARELAEMMIGSELPSPETRESTVQDRVLLEVSGLSLANDVGRALLKDVSFKVHAGEIVGIAGIEGNGQAQLVDALIGLEENATGRIVLAGDDLVDNEARDRRAAGMGLIPEDRQRQGLLLPSPLWENAALGHQYRRPFARGIWMDRREGRRQTEEIVRRFRVKTPTVDVPATALSGGNQQKLVVGREITAEPLVLIAAQPTRGIDVGAQAAVWEELKRARAAGLGILLLSADLEELIGLSDTIHVLFKGEFVARLDPAQVTPEDLGTYMTGAAKQVAV
ncbi:MAG: ABC transporter ATP-binding protein [Actinobacteria bacterium]|nr:ABC transporter ATP-binding protein [Actinomycetota bacterium]MCI0544573.1 ABC transporter ATP-binding protein [Actinomycetota bacterium]MCI0677918.1 ABC transporter ATP-binding protein [Actinomycetota bacterium]